MRKPRYFSGFWLVTLVFLMAFAALPVPAQVQPESEAMPGPLIRVLIADLKVQGERPAEAVREALAAILPQVVDCFQAEYERVGKVPSRIMLRFNLSSNGRVVWSKLIDPPLKSMDTCLAKVMMQLKLDSSGSTLTRGTLILEAKLDHLLGS